MFDAEVILLHVCDESEEILMDEKNSSSLYEDLKKNISYEKVSFELIKDNDVVKGIDDYVTNNPVDINYRWRRELDSIEERKSAGPAELRITFFLKQRYRMDMRWFICF